VLAVTGIRKSYGPVAALRNAHLSVHAGEVVALAGDNGAGKSTLIKILSGITQPDEGRIVFEGRTVSIHRPDDAARLGVQTVYQDLALCDNLDVVENIFLGREQRQPFWHLFRLRRPRMERLALEALDSLGVRISHLNMPVAALSGGQRQCTAVCRAILGNPKVIILDEPTAALGVTQTREVLGLIDRLRGQGRGVIMVSHDLSEVLRIADRIVVLRLGETIADKKSAEWTEHGLVSAITGGAEFSNGG
jgi:D-xylose transport system ATP-binding protein